VGSAGSAAGSPPCKPPNSTPLRPCVTSNLPRKVHAKTRTSPGKIKPEEAAEHSPVSARGILCASGFGCLFDVRSLVCPRLASKYASISGEFHCWDEQNFRKIFPCQSMLCVYVI